MVDLVVLGRLLRATSKKGRPRQNPGYAYEIGTKISCRNLNYGYRLVRY